MRMEKMISYVLLEPPKLVVESPPGARIDIMKNDSHLADTGSVSDSGVPK